MPWLPVAFGFGIVVYFTWPCGPPRLWLLRRRSWLFWRAGVPLRFRWRLRSPLWGWGLPPLQTVRIGHSILQRPISSALLAGFVEIREERERSDRIVIRVQRFEASGISSAPPERVRVAVRKGSAPAVGSFVELKAHLSPPLQPLRPGGYDFARDMFFQRIGASGYTLGAIKVKSTPVERGFWPRYASAIDDLRETMDKRIRAAIPDDNGSIASALITGKRDAISTPVNGTMYVAHVLSIFGYHLDCFPLLPA